MSEFFAVGSGAGYGYGNGDGNGELDFGSNRGSTGDEPDSNRGSSVLLERRDLADFCPFSA